MNKNTLSALTLYDKKKHTHIFEKSQNTTYHFSQPKKKKREREEEEKNHTTIFYIILDLILALIV